MVVVAMRVADMLNDRRGSAGNEAGAALGARSPFRVFAVSPDSRQDQILAALSFWSAVHGPTMLVIDNIPKAEPSVDDMIERLLRTLVEGLRRGRATRGVLTKSLSARTTIRARVARA
jgi:hypothetical protein